ncbi:MAG: tetratricopeptide repeat protein [Beijerinckiaceae bacterium]
MKPIQLASAALLALALGACQSTDLSTALKADTASVTASTGVDPLAGPRPKPGDNELATGKEHFRNANFGLAEKHFRQAAEQSPDSLEALIGLAAAYDQLGRFDLADRAYKEAFRIGGSSSVLLNNRGYSYYLRRDFRKARTDFTEALRRDPENATAKRNMALINGRA